MTKIKHLLFEHRLKGGKPIMICERTTEFPHHKTGVLVTKDEFLITYPKKPLEYFDRALENLGRLVSHPTSELLWNGRHDAAVFSEGGEVDNMVKQLDELGYIEIRPAETHDDDDRITIRAAGWHRIQELEAPGRDAKQAFVAMWFNPSQTTYFDNGFKPAIEEDKKVVAIRIDRKDHNNKIDDEIVAEIRRSRYLVADFTGHRGGVYFEAGFALGLGLPVIWTCHESHIKDAHFDTRQYNHITYTTPEDLRVKLLNRVRATIA